jgi:hypothetical protein
MKWEMPALVSAWAIAASALLVAGGAGLPGGMAYFQDGPGGSVMGHWCPDNRCPLDQYGCHYDESGRYHCH